MCRDPLLAAARALLLALCACADPVDQAAKARIFSPEEPAEDVLRAREAIAADRAGMDAAVERRILRMDRLEAARRLGAHKAVTTVKFAWIREGRTVALAEKHELAVDAEGQFRAVSTNDQDAGLEVVYAGGRAYVKSRYGPFRLRRMDGAQQDAWRDRATPAAATLSGLLGDRLRLSDAKPVRVKDRPARRWALGLGDAPAGVPAAELPPLPPVAYGRYRAPGEDKLLPGPDPDTARRLQFGERRTPQAVSGSLLVDDATGVLLALDAKARFEVAAADGAPARLDLELALEVSPEAKVAVEAPAEVAAERIAHAVKEPLWFLGASAPAASKPEDAEAADGP